MLKTSMYLYIYIYIYNFITYPSKCVQYTYYISISTPGFFRDFAAAWLFGSRVRSFSASFQAARWSWPWEQHGTTCRGNSGEKTWENHRKLMGK